jgi:hypothetical protein
MVSKKRALHGRGTLRLPDIGREASRPYNRNHPSSDFFRDHHSWGVNLNVKKNWKPYEYIDK